MRIELRPSRLLAGMLVVLGLAAALSLHLSDMPALPSLASGLLAVAWGALLARRELAATPRALAFLPDGSVVLDGHPLDSPKMDWRGPIMLLAWADGARRHYLAGWPDVLRAPARRELRLWALRHRNAASALPVAP